jgi:hypothetical protein
MMAVVGKGFSVDHGLVGTLDKLRALIVEWMVDGYYEDAVF